MLSREVGHVLIREVEFEVESQREKGSLKSHGRNRWRRIALCVYDVLQLLVDTG